MRTTTRLVRSTRGDRAVAAAKQQVSFPVTGHRTISHFRWSLADVDGVTELPAAVVVRTSPPRTADRPPHAQVCSQLPLQRAPRLHKQRRIDGLVRHLELRLSGMLTTEPARDLLGGPAELEFRRHERAQLAM